MAGSGPTLGKRIAFSLILLLGLYVSLEIIAVFFLLGIEGKVFRFARAQEERDALRFAAEPELPDVDLLRQPAQVLNHALHPYVGYVISPESEMQSVYGARQPAINRFGYSDDNDPIQARTEDRVIVAILGGSVAGGLGGMARPLASSLKSSPHFSNKSFHFVRLALAGYKQPQQLMTISYLLALGAEFDIVINLDGFNEVALHPAVNARTQTFAAYPTQWFFRVANLPEKSAAYRALHGERQKVAELHSRSGLRHSVFGNLIWKLRDRRLERHIQQAHEVLLSLADEQQPYEVTGPPREYVHYQELMRHLVSIWKDSSLQLARLSRANDIAYFHFLQPNQYVSDAKPMSPEEQEVARLEDHPYRRGVQVGYPMLIEAGADLARQGVAFFDLTPVFADVREPVYIDNCCHYNRRGYEIVTEAVARAILEHFDAEAQSGSSSRARS